MGLHPQALGSIFQGMGIWVTCGHPAQPEAQAHCKPPPPGQLHQQSGPCRSWAAGLCAQTPTPSGSLAVQATGVLRTPVSGAVPRSMAPVQLTYFQELAGALQSKRQAPRRLLSCPPSLTVNTAVLSGFPSALPAPLRPILESEPRHITPAALLRCPSAEGPAQWPALSLRPHAPPQLPTVLGACPVGTDDKAFRQTWFSPAPGGPGSTCSLHTTGRPPAPAPSTAASHNLTAPTHPPSFPCSDRPGKTWSLATIPKGPLTDSDVTEGSMVWLRGPGAGLRTAPGVPQQCEAGPHLEHEALAAGGVQHGLQGEVAEARVVGPALRHLGEEAADALGGCS